MEPAIHLGSAIVVEPVDPRSLAVGDVVSLRSGPNRAIFSHRIIRVVVRDGAVWIETKGDANAAADPSLTPASQVIGRASATIPMAGLPDRAPVVAPRDRLRRLAGSRADPCGVARRGPRPCTAPERGAVATGGTSLPAPPPTRPDSPRLTAGASRGGGPSAPHGELTDQAHGRRPVTPRPGTDRALLRLVAGAGAVVDEEWMRQTWPSREGMRRAQASRAEASNTQAPSPR